MQETVISETVVRRRGRPPKVSQDVSRETFEESCARKVSQVRLHIAQQIGTTVTAVFDAQKHGVQMQELENGSGIEVHMPDGKTAVVPLTNVQIYFLAE